MNSKEQPEVKKSPAFFIPPINKEGYPIILIAGLGSLFLGIFSLSVGLLGFVITLFVLFFFRDPPRMVPRNANLVLSPADGIVAEIAEVNCFPPELAMEEAELVRISIFLSIFDVHVNRIPVAGIVKALIYIPGVFSNAFFSQSSFKNERQIVLIENSKQEQFVVVQIAGLAARRVVCKLTSGQKVAQGSRFGIIKFGSRVDVYLPRSYAIQVVYGQVVTGGETILALPSGNSFAADDFSII